MTAEPSIIAGASLLEITPIDCGLVVGCPGCGAQTIFPLEEEPLLEHASIDCPVFRAIVRAFQRFSETKEIRG